VVVSAHPLASEAGAKILKWEEMPMMLLLPHNMHLPLYIRRQEISAEADFWLVKNNGEKFTLDYRETAPKKAAICTSIKR
jgi:gamma-glutamyltranspeptidase/glutathione hydrolase